jgi:UDP:flavonoid glycosyltransferase YjiC (YdhE family)
MRVLFTGAPITGHLLPLFPLARAFRRRGDTVVFLVPRSVAGLFTDEDVETLFAGAESDDIVAETNKRTGANVAAGEGGRDAALEVFVTARLDLSLDACTAAAREWGPDLVIHDPMDFVAPYIATVCAVPHVVHTFGPDVSADFIRAATKRAVRDYAARGAQWQAPRWTVDICPPDLQVDDWQQPAGWTPLRPEAHRAGPRALAREPKSLTGDPKVLLTFGTVSNDPAVLSPLINALTAHGVIPRVTLSTTTSADDFTVDHAEVAFETFMPYDALLDGIDIVLGHGGAGTVLGALTAGLPLVLIPQGADQGGQAARAAAAGAAVRIPADAADPAAVARAVLDMAKDPEYRRNARKVARSIAAMPSSDEVAGRLASEIRAKR